MSTGKEALRIQNIPRLGASIDGARDVYVLAILSYGNESFYGSMTWREFL